MIQNTDKPKGRSRVLNSLPCFIHAPQLTTLVMPRVVMHRSMVAKKCTKVGQQKGPFAYFLENQGIVAQYTTLRTPQQNKEA